MGNSFLRSLSFLPLAVLSLLICAAAEPPDWKLVWADEFDGRAGTPPKPMNWNYDLGGGGWGNNEAQTYTNSTKNAFHDGNGHLVIRAIRDSAGHYTSARLQTGRAGASTKTANRTWQYGRLEARIKLPYGEGVWPAFWLLGGDFDVAGWPASGELDVVERFGATKGPSTVNAAAHGPGYSGGNSIARSYSLPAASERSDDYHVYGIEWFKDSVEWFLDGQPVFKLAPDRLPRNANWVFSKPMFILLNVAIGTSATFVDAPEPNRPFPPQDMLVDYVRVYQRAIVPR